MKVEYAGLSIDGETVTLPMASRHGSNRRVCLFAFLLLAGVSSSLAQEFKSGNITIEGPWAPATPKGAEVGAGFFTIRNDGAFPDRLIGLTADFGALELHEMRMEQGVMSMPAVEGGLNIPAHGTVRLAPGGYHVMFEHLKHPLARGEKVKAVLTFERAPPLTIEFSVERVGASERAPQKSDQMGGMKM
jgi:copper(I)-binding protein